MSFKAAGWAVGGALPPEKEKRPGGPLRWGLADEPGSAERGTRFLKRVGEGLERKHSGYQGPRRARTFRF